MLEYNHISKRMARWAIVVLLGTLLTSCYTDDMLSDAPPLPEKALTVKASIFEGSEHAVSGKTRAVDTDEDIAMGDDVDGRDELRENFFGTLDLFVKRHDDAADQPWFKQYHLVAGQGSWLVDDGVYDEKSLLNEARQLLAANWGTEGFVPQVEYDIYATANNPHTIAGVAPATLEGLQSLSTFDVQLFRYQWHSDAEPDWSNYMQVDANNEPKKFLMDGKIEGWTIDPDSKQQEFDMDLKRAAAKIIVNIKYDGENATVLKQAEDADEPEKDELGKNIYTDLKSYLDFVNREPGAPRWKYVNFGRKVSDIADGNYVIDMDDDEGSQAVVHTWESNFTVNKNEDETVSNIDGTYTIVTYAYPTDWTGQQKQAPYILLSIAYTNKLNPQDMKVNYYRIPVCDESRVTRLERNNIYLVDVSIASLGADNASFELEDEQLRIEYHVIPWTASNVGQEITNVKITDTKYFMVTPTNYILKGDNVQTTEFDWYASVSSEDDRYVDIDPNSLTITYSDYQGNTQNIRGTVTKTPANPNGTQDIVITSTAPTNVANGENVTITVTPGGLIYVSSQALLNRAVKEISFKVRLTTTNFEETITLRHFPLDNIQNIEGRWSSRWSPSYEYTFDLSEAESWGSYHTEEIQVSAGDPYDRIGTDYIVETTTQTRFRNAVPATARGTLYDSRADSYHASDGYDYWGVLASDYSTYRNSNDQSNNYDYYVYQRLGVFGRYYYYYYNYTTYYRGHNVTAYYRTRYYRESSTGTPQTGNWVDYENRTGTINQDDNFRAKIYDGGVCKEINTNYSIGASVGATLTNNHMYVIQITSASSQYAIGKPVISDYQSQDHVVSPAFMLASQLGAVTTFSGNDAAYRAAVHCGTYMEVGTDGTRYVGWRLPTTEEINVIIGYQNGTYTQNRTMVEVLGGRYYWALNGTAAYVSTGSEGTTTNAYVRCVRDLSLDEIRKLSREE